MEDYNNAMKQHRLGLLPDPPPLMAGVLAIFLALIEVFLDWTTQVHLNFAIIYSLPLIVAAASRSRRLLWGLAAFLVLMTFSVYCVQIPPAVFTSREPLFVNRVLAAAVLLLTAGLLHLWVITVETTEEQSRLVHDQNERLEAANRELQRREEEIACQNEELDRRRREAEQASARKTRFLASASHDIRAPVNAINLMAEVIRRTADNPALVTQVPDMAQRLQANALSLVDLVSEILDIARFDSGQSALQISTFSLNDLAADECRLMLPLAQAKNLRLEFQAPSSAIWIRTDRVKLSRVLGNLLSNAIKFTEFGGVTVKSALAPEGGVFIAVRDTGSGVAPEYLDHIFEEFAQLGNAELGRNKGWGLGLAICRRLMEALGGTITVESQLRHGSVFTVSLPCSCVLNLPSGEREESQHTMNGARPC